MSFWLKLFCKYYHRVCWQAWLAITKRNFTAEWLRAKLIIMQRSMFVFVCWYVSMYVYPSHCNYPIPSHAGQEYAATALKTCSFSGLQSSLLRSDCDVRVGTNLCRRYACFSSTSERSATPSRSKHWSRQSSCTCVQTWRACGCIDRNAWIDPDGFWAVFCRRDCDRRRKWKQRATASQESRKKESERDRVGKKWFIGRVSKTLSQPRMHCLMHPWPTTRCWPLCRLHQAIALPSSHPALACK